MKLATFGAGCFWGVEDAFRRVPGVVGTAVGYTGGTKVNPTYKEVCTDETGHAEVVQVEYDPEKVDYDTLLDVFWKIHDPTTRNRQGPDFGSQYRSVIFYHDDAQQAAASRVEAEGPGQWTIPPRYRHRDRPGGNILPRRGVPPAVSRQARRRVFAASLRDERSSCP